MKDKSGLDGSWIGGRAKSGLEKGENLAWIKGESGLNGMKYLSGLDRDAIGHGQDCESFGI